MKVRIPTIVILLLCTIFAGHAMAEEGLQYPLRAKYADLKPIETDELAAIYDQAIIIDARNAMEFKVLHMKGAHNFLVGKMKERDLLSLRSKNDPTPMVFYCNGITCSKSYKATAKAAGWGFTNVFVYDAGIFHWAKKHPEWTVFFGEPLTAENVASKLISKEEFAAVLLPPADFIAKAKSGAYTVFDIRDPNERSEHPIRLAKMRTMSFDTMVSLLEKGSKAVPKRSILVIDNVGKQVKWLQYFLKQYGVSDYYFLKGGVLQWVKDGYDAQGNK